MSRALGRMNDVLHTVELLQESSLQKYKRNKEESSWKSIESIPERIKLYLPDSAIDFIEKEKIRITKNPLRKYTYTNIPEFPDEERFIVFPSIHAIKEYEREYAFYLGSLLASYQIDTQEELLESGKEYDDLLPLLIDYLFLKSTGKEDIYSKKYLCLLKQFSKYYKKLYEQYQNFYEFSSNSETYSLSDKEYDNFKKMCDNYDDEMERLTMENIIKMSAIDATLQIIDKNLSDKEYQELIEELMINKSENRSSILYERGIESYGYKRLKKEIQIYNK